MWHETVTKCTDEVGVRYIRPLIMALVLSITTISTQATSKELMNGESIALRSYENQQNYIDSRSNLEMVLIDKSGKRTNRRLKSQSLEVEGDGDRTLMVFETPKDQRGTALLSYSHKSDPDDQWLYLPALKRVKRIASRNKSGPFLGSEFAFEDLTKKEFEKYNYKYIAEDVHAGNDAYIVEFVPKDPYSGYSKQLVWIDKSQYRIQQIDFYDRKDSHLKRLVFKGYRLHDDQHWRADEAHMENLQTGKRTILRFSEFQFNTGLTEADFNKNSLQRAR